MQINFEISSHNFGFRSIKFLSKLNLMFYVGLLGTLRLILHLMQDFNMVHTVSSYAAKYEFLKYTLIAVSTSTVLYASVSAIGINFF
jgi:hypothetical protein